MKRQDVLTIDGMFCAGCAASVEAVLCRSTGVQSAAVNFAADAAVVEWNDSKTDLAALLAAVGKLGYTARRVGDEDSPEDPATAAKRDFSIRLAVAVFFGIWTMLPSFALHMTATSDPTTLWRLALLAGVFTLPVICYSGVPFYRMAWKTLRSGVPGMDAMISIGLVGSVVVSAVMLASGSSDVYFEVAAALISFQLLARLLDLRVRRRARDTVSQMVELAPTTMTRIGDDESEETVLLKDIAVGDRIRLKPGMRLSVDGTITNGRAMVDRSLLSGESQPAALTRGDRVFAGERVIDGALTVEVEAGAMKRRIDGLSRIVRQTLARKPPWQRAADTLARYFIWIALGAALLSAAIVIMQSGTGNEAAIRALAVFVIACPCALSMAAPLAGLFASSGAMRRGIVVRDLNAISTAAAPDIWFLDKTGTLTVGKPTVVAVHTAVGVTEDDLLSAAAVAESQSEHPLAHALRAAAPPADRIGEGETRVEAGRGITWSGKDETIAVGQPDWIASHIPVDTSNLPNLPDPGEKTRVAVARNGTLLGAIDIADEMRPDAREAIERLRATGARVVMLSGDAPGAVRAVADALNVEAEGGLEPESKIARIEAEQASGKTVGFAGDGLNDGPAIAAADLGVAVGTATDVARAASAITLVERGVEALPELVAMMKRSRRVMLENLWWAVAYNAVAIPAAIAGYVHPAIAAIAMALSSMTVLVNSLRLRAGPPTASTTT